MPLSDVFCNNLYLFFPSAFCAGQSVASWLWTLFLHSSFLLPDYKAFEEAAEHFQPYIKFFATFDKGVSIPRLL